MKRFSTFIIIMMLALCASAQSEQPSLIVFDIQGKITTLNKSKSIAVAKRQTLRLTDRISIPDNGFIKLIDTEGRKMYTLKNKSTGQLSTLIENQKPACKNLTKQYFAYVMKSLTRTDTDRVYDTGLTTGTYRNDADSLLCDIDSLQDVVDSLQNVINMMKNDSVKKK